MTSLQKCPRSVPCLPKGPHRTLHLINPVAFCLALTLAPLLIAATCFWLLGIPLFALFFGTPYYVLFGVPVLLWAMPRIGADAAKIAGLAFLTDLAFVLAILAGFEPPGWPPSDEVLRLFAGFSLIVAPLWGAAFGVIYNRLYQRLSPVRTH